VLDGVIVPANQQGFSNLTKHPFPSKIQPEKGGPVYKKRTYMDSRIRPDG